MPDVAGVSGERLRALVEKIERLEEEKRELQETIKEVFAEAKGDGFDVKVLRQLIRLRRIKPHERAETEELLETYKAALGML